MFREAWRLIKRKSSRIKTLEVVLGSYGCCIREKAGEQLALVCFLCPPPFQHILFQLSEQSAAVLLVHLVHFEYTEKFPI